ncbi:MAG: hypothetical protein R3C12_03940 [Planctomycetaceae bacterium]
MNGEAVQQVVLATSGVDCLFDQRDGILCGCHGTERKYDNGSYNLSIHESSHR